MKIYILSKQDFVKKLSSLDINDTNVVVRDKDAFISINNSDSIDPYFKNNYKNVLNLFFDDITEDYEVADIFKYGDTVGHVKRKLRSFKEDDAKQILNFINTNKDVDTLIIHCSAGISRSGAVGLFINDYFKQDYHEFMKINPKVKPNSLVTKLLKMEYETRI